VNPATPLPNIEAVWTPAVQQSVYRSLLHATAYPGTACELTTQVAQEPAWLAALACIVDHSVTLCDLHSLCDERTCNFLGCTAADIRDAAYVLADAVRPATAEHQPTCGSLVAPELGATIVLRVDGLGHGARELLLRGPGIAERRRVAVAGLDESWLRARRRWCAGYPRGVDLLLCDRRQVLALPRTTRIDEEER